MKKLILAMLVFPFLISCGNNNLESNENDEDNTQKSVDAIKKTDWPKTFQNKKLGKLNAGENIETAVEMLKQYFTVVKDSLPACMECPDEFETYYKVTDQHEKLVFSIHTTQKNPDAVAYIQLYDEEYKSPEGIHIGSTAKELKKAYTIKEAHFDFNNGLFLFAKDFPGAFRFRCCEELEKTDYDFTRPNVSTFPDTLDIEMIVIREE